MPTINNIGFTVKFDLLSTPTLVLTDTSTYPAGAVGIFNITQPDGYTRTGNFNSPDVTVSGGTFSSLLRLSSTGGVQNGEYVIEYEIETTDDVITTFTRTFQVAYDAAVLNLREDFDVFTPKLRYFDDTVYAKSNFNNGAITRAWSVTSTPTGTKTSSTNSIDLIHDNKYFDANYTVNFTASVLYTHQVYTWFTIDERVNTTVTTYAQTPPGLVSIVTQISALKTILNQKVNTGNEFGQVKADFEYAQTLFVHIIDKIKTEDVADIYKDIKDLIAVLNNYQPPAYTPCNCQIFPYDLSAYFPGAVWGNITGDITAQSDLWNYLSSLISQNNFVFDKQVAASVWVVVHNMGKFPSVSIVDTANDQVEGEVRYNSNNQLTITFTAAVAGKAYLN
jgi:hypothetical protein